MGRPRGPVRVVVAYGLRLAPSVRLQCDDGPPVSEPECGLRYVAFWCFVGVSRTMKNPFTSNKKFYP